MTLNILKFSTNDSVVLTITNTGKMFSSRNYSVCKAMFYFMYVLCRFSAWNLLFFVWPNSFCKWLSCIFGLAHSSECIERATLNLVYIIVFKRLVVILQSDTEDWENLYFKVLSLVPLIIIEKQKELGKQVLLRKTFIKTLNNVIKLLTFAVKRKL